MPALKVSDQAFDLTIIVTTKKEWDIKDEKSNFVAVSLKYCFWPVLHASVKSFFDNHSGRTWCTGNLTQLNQWNFAYTFFLVKKFLGILSSLFWLIIDFFFLKKSSLLHFLLYDWLYVWLLYLLLYFWRISDSVSLHSIVKYEPYVRNVQAEFCYSPFRTFFSAFSTLGVALED